MRIYIENLDGTIDDDGLRQIFSAYGEVRSAVISKDLFTDVSRGFGYVEMDDEASHNAIKALDQTTLNNLLITVKEAPPAVDRKGSYKVGNGAVNIYRFRKN